MLQLCFDGNQPWRRKALLVLVQVACLSQRDALVHALQGERDINNPDLDHTGEIYSAFESTGHSQFYLESRRQSTCALAELSR